MNGRESLSPSASNKLFTGEACEGDALPGSQPGSAWKQNTSLSTLHGWPLAWLAGSYTGLQGLNAALKTNKQTTLHSVCS